MSKEINVFCGFHAIETALATDRHSLAEIVHYRMKESPRLGNLLSRARSNGVKIRRAQKKELDNLAGDVRHQGVVGLLAKVPGEGLSELRTWLNEFTGVPLIIILDGLEDPRNIGACLRTAAAASVDAVIIPVKGGAGLTPAALRVAEGGFHHLRIFEVGNWSQVLKMLKTAGIWVLGASETGRTSLDEFDLTVPVAWIFGSEATGIRQISAKHCDALVRVPTEHDFPSLNVAVATGVALFETKRQRKVLSKNS